MDMNMTAEVSTSFQIPGSVLDGRQQLQPVKEEKPRHDNANDEID